MSKKLLQRAAFWLQLGKPHISLPVSLSSLTGFLLYAQSFATGWVALFAGIFCLSFASAAINQIQEKKYDRMMVRTSKRPLPSRSISTPEAWLVTTAGALAGTLLLWQAGGPAAASLGWLNILLYNGFYTYLKRITIFAVIPGSLVGAIPPVIGWISAGGEALHLHIFMVAMFFFIGQIPHTWLILLRYDKEYQEAGFPSLTGIFSLRQVRALTFVWVVATAMSATILALSGVFHFKLPAVATMAFAFLLVVFFGRWLGKIHSDAIRPAFMALNMLFLIVMLMLITDSLLA